MDSEKLPAGDDAADADDAESADAPGDEAFTAENQAPSRQVPLARLWDRLPTLTKLEAWLCKVLNVTRSQDRLLISTALNFIFIFSVVLLVDSLFLVLTRDDNSLYLYQKFLAWFIVVTLNSLGVEGANWSEPPGTAGPVLILPDVSHGLEIASACAGLRETLFLGLLVLLFRDVRLKVRIKWVVIFAIIIFIENIVRILSIYPVERAYDFDTWDRFHYYWWNVGQFIFIITLFLLWVHFVAHKDIQRQRRERKRQKEREAENEPTAEPGKGTTGVPETDEADSATVR